MIAIKVNKKPQAVTLDETSFGVKFNSVKTDFFDMERDGKKEYLVSGQKIKGSIVLDGIAYPSEEDVYKVRIELNYGYVVGYITSNQDEFSEGIKVTIKDKNNSHLSRQKDSYVPEWLPVQIKVSGINSEGLDGVRELQNKILFTRWLVSQVELLKSQITVANAEAFPQKYSKVTRAQLLKETEKER